jgi:hypothetical protein
VKRPLETVEPYEIRSWNPIWPWQYWTGKNFTITCGRCWHTWRAKLPIASVFSVRCPECRTRNWWQVEIVKMKDMDKE